MALDAPSPETDDGADTPFFEGLLADSVDQLVAAGMPEADAIDSSVQILFELLPKFAEMMRKSLHASKDELLANIATDRAELQDIIDADYGTALRNFEAVAYLSYELGLKLHEEYVDSGLTERSVASCEVLFLLHGRACTIASEVLHLLRGGFGDGASARYRTIHELAVVMDIIGSDEAHDLAERYLDFSIVERYTDMMGFQQNAEALGYAHFSPDEVAEIEQDYQSVLARRGQQFRRRNQWAAPLFPPGRDIQFHMLEQLVGVAHKRPHYRLANHFIHAGPRAALLNLHNQGRWTSIGVGARAGEDIAETAHGTLLHLVHCTAALIVHLHKHVDAKYETVLGLATLQRFVDDAGLSLSRASARLTSM